MYDVAIIGLGPAGSTLARLLHPSLSVIAIDKKRDSGEDGFRKPCGGLLAMDAQKALSRFSLTLPLEVMVSPQIFSVRTIDVKARKIRHYQRFYINLDRHKFDLWLKSLIPAHVEVHSNARCRAIYRNENGYTIQYREEEQDFTVRTRYVVGSDGAHSMVRRFLYSNLKIRQYLSIQQWFPDQHPSPFYSCVFDRGATDCYAWGLSKNKYFVFGGAFPLRGAREKLENLKNKLAEFGFRLETPIKTEACLVLRPAGFGDIKCGRDGVFLLGEAGCFISPSSLEGISYAMDTAYHLSRVLNKGIRNPNALYQRRTLPIRVKLFLKHLKTPFMYCSPLRRLVMKSGIDSIDVLDSGPE